MIVATHDPTSPRSITDRPCALMSAATSVQRQSAARAARSSARRLCSEWTFAWRVRSSARSRFRSTTLDREEVADPPRARERVVCASNVIDVYGRRGTPRAARFQDDHRLGGAGRAGHHDDAAARGPFDLTHHPAGQATLTARAREPGEAIDIDERPVHAAVGSRQRASLLTRQARAVVMRCGAHMRVRHC